jgi:hypothetical protein
MHLRSAFSSLIAAVGLLAIPATSLAADHHSHGGHNHGGGHFNWHGDDHHGDHHDDHHHSSSHYYYPYYGYGGYYGWYRPYSWYPGTTLGLSLYDSGSRYSRYSSGDNLAIDVQRALRSRGYYRGAIDGDIGSGSRSAIRAYQRDHGLGVTGRIDTTLLRSLRVG